MNSGLDSMISNRLSGVLKESDQEHFVKGVLKLPPQPPPHIMLEASPVRAFTLVLLHQEASLAPAVVGEGCCGTASSADRHARQVGG